MKNATLPIALRCLATIAHAEKTSALTHGGALPVDVSNYIDQVDSDLPSSTSHEQGVVGGIGVDIYAGFMFAKASIVRVGYRALGTQEADIEYTATAGDFEFSF